MRAAAEALPPFPPCFAFALNRGSTPKRLRFAYGKMMTDVLCPAKSFIVLRSNSPSPYRAGRDARCNLITRYPDDHSTPVLVFSSSCSSSMPWPLRVSFGREASLTLISSYQSHDEDMGTPPAAGVENAFYSTPQGWKQTNRIDRIEGFTTFFFALLLVCPDTPFSRFPPSEREGGIKLHSRFSYQIATSSSAPSRSSSFLFSTDIRLSSRSRSSRPTSITTI
jgi:hypothetical protein